MATVYAHPTLLHSPLTLERFQRRTGLVVIAAGTVAIAIPSLAYHRAQQATRGAA